MRRSIRLVAINLGFALGGLVLTLLISEGAVRLFNLAPEIAVLELDTQFGEFQSDFELAYIPKPGSRGVNSYGIRDKEYSHKKQPGTFRIVVLGDSIAYGFCNGRKAHPIDSLFANVLEKHLNQSAQSDGTSYEVFNLGVSGYDTFQEVRFFERKGLMLNPDLVLVAYSPNDHSPTASLELKLFQELPGWETFLKQSGLSSVLFNYVSLFRFAVQRVDYLSRKFSSESKVVRKKTDDLMKIPREGFTRLRELTDVPVVVAIFPWLEGFNRDNISKYSFKWVHKKVAELARKNNFHLIDLFGPMVEVTGGDFHLLLDPCNAMHPNIRGHAFAGKALARYLRQNNFFSKRRGKA